MPSLTDQNQQFAISASSASPLTWTMQQQQTVTTPQSAGSATNQQNFDYEGVIMLEAVSPIGEPGIPGYTLEVTYLSIVNTGNVTQTVSYGKVILPNTYYQVSPEFLLAPGWSAIFVRDAGWFLFNENGVNQEGGGGSGGVTPATVYSASVYLNQSQSVPSSSDEMTTVVAFDTVNFDPSGMFNPTTHLFTAPAAGVYLVTGSITWGPDSGDTGGNRGAAFQVNGASPPLYGVNATASANTGQAEGGQVVTNTLTCILSLNEGDTVGIVCEPVTSDGSAVTIIGANVTADAQFFTMFEIAKLG
jgi:hypothetical protein